MRLLGTVLLGLACIVAVAYGAGCDDTVDIGTNNGCDCGCSMWDPDCDLSNSAVRCKHDGLNVFTNGLICVKNGSTSSCVPNMIAQNACDDQNRVWDDQSESCGACKTHFFSSRVDQSCQFLPYPLSFVRPGEFFQTESKLGTIDQAEGAALDRVLNNAFETLIENTNEGTFADFPSQLGGSGNKDYIVTNLKDGKQSYLKTRARSGSYFADLDGDGLTDMIKTYYVHTNGQRGVFYKYSLESGLTMDPKAYDLCTYDTICESPTRSPVNGLCNRHLIFWNTGNSSQPNFSEEWDYLDSFVSLRQCATWTLLLVDLDGDGKSEIVATTLDNCSSHKIVVLKRVGGTLRQPSFQPLEDIFEEGSFNFFAGNHCNSTTEFTSGQWTAGDFDNDGDIDLVFVQMAPVKLYWMQNIGNSTHPFFRPDRARNDALSSRLPALPNHFDLATLLEMHYNYGFVDVDGDGLLDIIVPKVITSSASYGAESTFTMYRNVGSWTFEYKSQGESFHFLHTRVNDRQSAVAVVNGLTGPGSLHFVSVWALPPPDLPSFEYHPLKMGFSAYFRTEGRVNAPRFSMVSSSLFSNFESLGDKYAILPSYCPFIGCNTVASWFETLALVDIDGDGDLDAFLTTSFGQSGYNQRQGHISFFPNIGTAENPIFAAASASCHEDIEKCPDFLKKMLAPWYSGIAKKDFSNFAFGDVDGDGDLDVVHGYARFYLSSNQGNKTHPDFTAGTKLSFSEPPLPDAYANQRTTQLVDLDGDGDLDLVITDASTENGGGASDFIFAQNDGLGNFTRLAKNDTANPLRDVKLGTENVTVGQAQFKFFDIDRDGDFDLVFLSKLSGLFQVWRNDGRYAPDQAIKFTRLLSSENPLVHLTIGVSSCFDIADLDNDGDVEIHAFDSRGAKMATDTASKCAHECLGRGTCIQNTAQGALGDCLCGDWFDGRWCERCSETRYGDQCSVACPDFSRTLLQDGQLSTGGTGFPVLSDCVCNPSFIKVSGEDDDAFQCSCPPGFGFNQLLESCEACPIGSFKSDAGLHACTQCDTIFGENRATTAEDRATSSDDCFCINPFVLDPVIRQCGCPAGFVLDTATNGSACICEQGLILSQDGGACESPPQANTIFTAAIASGGAALLVAASFLCFATRKHIPYIMPLRLPFGHKYYFFISYKQATGHAYAEQMYKVLIARGLDAWLDKHQDEINYNSMVTGVKSSAMYVIILSEGTLQSPAVLVELLTAVKENKPIVLCHVPNYPFSEALAKIEEPKVREIVSRLFQAINSIPAPCYLEPTKRETNAFYKAISTRYRAKRMWTYESISRALAVNDILEVQESIEKASEAEFGSKMDVQEAVAVPVPRP